MARIRTIKPEFWGDEKLAPLSPIDRLVFLGLVGMADDCGRLLDSVKVVDAFVFPYTDDTSGPSLDSLANLSRIIRGTTASGQRVIQIANWSKHQRVDKPNTKGALPEIVEPQQVAEIRDSFATHSRPPRAPTYDLRPTTDDDDQRRIPDNVWVALLPFLGDPKTKTARIGQVRGMLQGITSRPIPPEAMARGLTDLHANSGNWSAIAVRAFADKAVKLIEGEAGRRAAESSVSVSPSAPNGPSGWAEEDLE